MRLGFYLALLAVLGGFWSCAAPRVSVKPSPSSAPPAVKLTPTVQPPVLTPDQLLGLKRPPGLVKDPDSGQYALPEVMDAFLKLRARAEQDNWHLILVSGYRSFWSQRRIWNHYDNLYRSSDKLSEKARVRAIMSLVSVPGLSRHHWATELDISEKNLRGQLVRIQPSTPKRVVDFYNWMAVNAPQFGFCRVYLGIHGAVTDEPWHWSYFPYSRIYEKQFMALSDYHRILDISVDDVDYLMKNFPKILKREIGSVNNECGQ